MNAQVYEKAWGLLEPLMDDFLLLVQYAKETPETAYHEISLLCADLDNFRNRVLTPLGVTFEEVLLEQTTRIAYLEGK